MRNTIISIVCIMLITVYSVFSSIFVNRFSKTIEDKIIYADKNGYSISVADNIQKSLDDNMSVLLFTTSKEHIDVIENCVVNIRYAAEHNDLMTVQIYKTILLNTLEEISRLNKSPV